MSPQAHASYPVLLYALFGLIFQYPINAITLLVVVTASVLPDLDFIPALLKKDPSEYEVKHHERITHAPIAYVPLVMISVLLSPPTGLLIGFGLLSHFIMDTIISGDGIRWLYPLSNKMFLFNNPTRGLHGKQWTAKYKTLPIWFIDNTAFVTVIIIILITTL